MNRSNVNNVIVKLETGMYTISRSTYTALIFPEEKQQNFFKSITAYRSLPVNTCNLIVKT